LNILCGFFLIIPVNRFVFQFESTDRPQVFAAESDAIHKRVKRISSNNKSGPFTGSEFAYEDISSQEVDKYTQTLHKLCRVMNCGEAIVKIISLIVVL